MSTSTGVETAQYRLNDSRRLLVRAVGRRPYFEGKGGRGNFVQRQCFIIMNLSLYFLGFGKFIYCLFVF